MVSEVEKVDKVLRGEGHGATFWVVGCAGMVCVLRQRKGRHTQQSILHFASVSSSKCSFTSRFHVHFDQAQSIKVRKTHYLPEEDVAVCAEVQGVTVLLSVRVAAAQLEVHLLPLQVTFI